MTDAPAPTPKPRKPRLSGPAAAAKRLQKPITLATTWTPAPVIGGAPKPRGVPRKFTPTRQAEYLHYIARGMRRSAAAKATGVTMETVKRARDLDPDFVEKEALAEAEAAEVIEDALYETAKAGNVTAIIYILGNRQKDRWQDVRNAKIDHQISGKVTQEIEAGDRLAIIASQMARLEERAALRGLGAGGAIIDAQVIDEDDDSGIDE